MYRRIKGTWKAIVPKRRVKKAIVKTYNCEEGC